jgi:hypothetical protein
MLDLSAGDTRVFLFRSADAASDPGGAMDNVNSWLGKDRSQTQYSNLRVKDISIASDGAGGVYTVVVCSLGRQAGGASAESAV